MRFLVKLRWKIVLDRLALALSLVSSVLPIRSFSIQESNVRQRQRYATALEFDTVEWRKISVLKIITVIITTFAAATATATKTSLENKHAGNGAYFVVIVSSSHPLLIVERARFKWTQW